MKFAWPLSKEWPSISVPDDDANEGRKDAINKQVDVPDDDADEGYKDAMNKKDIAKRDELRHETFY